MRGGEGEGEGVRVGWEVRLVSLVDNGVPQYWITASQSLAGPTGLVRLYR